MSNTENTWAKLDDTVDILAKSGKICTERLSVTDVDDLLPLLVSATETKFLPSLDTIDPDKVILHSFIAFLETGDRDEIFRMTDILREGLIQSYKVRIDNMLTEKLKENVKSEDQIC